MIAPNGQIGQVVTLHVVQEIRPVHDNVVQIVAVLYQLNNSHVIQIPYVQTIVTIVKTGLNGVTAVSIVALELKQGLNHAVTQIVQITQRVEHVIQV